MRPTVVNRKRGAYQTAYFSRTTCDTQASWYRVQHHVLRCSRWWCTRQVPGGCPGTENRGRRGGQVHANAVVSKTGAEFLLFLIRAGRRASLSARSAVVPTSPARRPPPVPPRRRCLPTAAQPDSTAPAAPRACWASSASRRSSIVTKTSTRWCARSVSPSMTFSSPTRPTAGTTRSGAWSTAGPPASRGSCWCPTTWPPRTTTALPSLDRPRGLGGSRFTW